MNSRADLEIPDLPLPRAVDINSRFGGAATTLLRAIIFDFNGIILDDEEFHFGSMRDAVAPHGIRLTREEYFARYLPLDTRRCLNAVCRDHGIQLTESDRDRTLREISRNYRRMLKGHHPLFPGAAELVRAASQAYPLAIASGATREEIESTLEATGLRDCFRAVVSAEDFKRGKPHPESFLLALDTLNAMLNGHSPPILPSECLVVEDSVGGVRGARLAGMVCLAVTNSYPQEHLAEANLVVASLEGLELENLRGLFKDTL